MPGVVVAMVVAMFTMVGGGMVPIVVPVGVVHARVARGEVVLPQGRRQGGEEKETRPVTVLSRCQRFDLRRIEPEVMIAHLASVAAKEGAEISEEALALITRAAEGSVRDAMSLMDQAISHGHSE